VEGDNLGVQPYRRDLRGRRGLLPGSLAGSRPDSAGLGSGVAEVAGDHRHGCVLGICGGEAGRWEAAEGEAD